MKLIQVEKPKGKFEPADYEPLNKEGWIYRGFYVNGEYYERAMKDGKQKWFKLEDK